MKADFPASRKKAFRVHGRIFRPLTVEDTPMAAPTKPSPSRSRTRAPESKQRAAAEAPHADVAASAGGAVLSNFTGVRRVPTPVNEPVKSYAPGSPERAELKARLD